MIYQEIQDHMKKKFQSNEKIEKIDNITDDKLETKLSDNKIYEAVFGSLAIDIIDSKKK